jgi:hypothetical protein
MTGMARIPTLILRLPIPIWRLPGVVRKSDIFYIASIMKKSGGASQENY